MGAAHLGASFLVAPATGGPRLGYLTAMERDEAGSTGLELLTPETLGIETLRRQAGSDAELWAALLAGALETAGLEPGPIGLAGRHPAGTVHAACSRLAEAGWGFRPAHRLLLELRKRKTGVELEEIRRAGRAATAAMHEVARLLAASRASAEGLRLAGEPLTAGRLRRAIAGVLAAHEVEQPEGNIVATGRAAGVPHSQGSSEVVLQAGEALVVDLFPRGLLYADCTRTFCVGPPPAALARAQETVERALVEARSAARPGIRGSELQASACELFERAGYPTPDSHPGTRLGYVHGLGHGVGFDLHEYPSFRPADDARGTLEVGDVFTIEPGLYDADAGWGVRLEDLCYLGSEGLEVLTPLPFDLAPETWAPA